MIQPGDLVCRRARRKIYYVLQVMQLELVVFDLQSEKVRYVSRDKVEIIKLPALKTSVGLPRGV